MNTIGSYGTQVILEANGGACANNTIIIADDLTISQTQSGDFRNGLFSLMVNYTTGPTANRTIDLIIQPLAFEGTNDEPNPTATHLHHFFASFRPQAITGAQWMYAEAVDLPRAFRAWLFNNNTGQTIPAGWTLRYQPFTLRAQA